ncbi:MAG: hypothetical protein P1U42_10450 [Phycisphaerales bacterium]|nr:hypothetical protein [Phycisphaerales bacterium]
MANNTENKDENADFERGLFVCSKPGVEFAGTGSAGMVIGLVGTQVFAAMMIVPILGFFVLRNWFGVAPWVAGVFAGVISVIFVALGLLFLTRINKANRNQGSYFKNESDSRYRVRVVIPQKQRDLRVHRWVQLASEGALREEEKVTEDELTLVRGGVEPLVIRPWFGVKRDRVYWWTSAIMCVVVGFAVSYALTFLFGGWRGLLDSIGIMGYALTGLMLLGGVVIAEVIWPVYIRLVPGQVDVFRYGFLGSGAAKVESFDLRKVGVCVDFGGYIISLEPERAVGEALPILVQAKRWPHGQSFPEDFTPTYFAIPLVLNRRIFAQRLIQASRTDEPTPPVSMSSLGE